MYPVINLRRLRMGARVYVETLEDCMVAACSHYGIQARVSLNPGRRRGLLLLRKVQRTSFAGPGSFQNRRVGR